jgi:hypothetical protein
VKRYGRLFNQLVSFEHLLAAAEAARRGKRFRQTTARFDFDLEHELLALQQELLTQTYRPGPYCTFTIREPTLLSPGGEGALGCSLSLSEGERSPAASPLSR